MPRLPRLLVVPLLLLSASVAGAQDHDHEEHSARLGDLTVLHAWTTPAQSGEDALVFFEVENDGVAVELTGGEAEIAASVEVVGATMAADGNRAYQPLGTVTLPAGAFHFDPAGLALRLNGLNTALVQGEHLHMHVLTSAGELEISVDVEAPGATAHSH